MRSNEAESDMRCSGVAVRDAIDAHARGAARECLEQGAQRVLTSLSPVARPHSMRPLTEEETKAFFEKLSK